MEQHIEVRPISQTDIVPIAKIHRKAFQHSALSYLGVGALARYYDWLLNGPHQHLCEAVFVDGVLAGYCYSGRFKGAVSGFLKKNKLYLGMMVVLKSYLVFKKEYRKKLNFANAIFGRMKKDEGYSNRGLQMPQYRLLAIAVDPDVQGKGLGRMLMDSAEREAIARGFTRMTLTVETDNDQAVRFYLKHGWTKNEADGAWEGRMYKPIAPAEIA